MGGWGRVPVFILACGMAILGCAGGPAQDDDVTVEDETGHRNDSTIHRAAPEDRQTLEAQCAGAAQALGFQVPCPQRLPTVAGEAALCDANCVAQAGVDETLGSIFFLELNDFDSTETFEVRHLAIEARRVDRAPGSPCPGASAPGTTRIGARQVNILLCPQEPPDPRAIRHGEAMHLGHILGYWDEAGVRYSVSVHGHGVASRALLEGTIASVDLVGR